MKEATGELSMTAIAVVAIAAIAVVFSTLVWPSLKANIERNTHCAQSYGCSGDDGKTQNCFYLDEKGEEKPVVCPSDK